MSRRRRPAADPSAALRLLADIQRAARLAEAVQDDTLHGLFHTTAAAVTDALARHRALCDGPDGVGARRGLEESHAETMAWTPVVQQVHVLALRLLGTARHAEEHARAGGPATVRVSAMVAALHDTEPACTGGQP